MEFCINFEFYRQKTVYFAGFLTVSVFLDEKVAKFECSYMKNLDEMLKISKKKITSHFSANSSQIDFPDLSSSRAPWSTKKGKKHCNYTGGCLFEKSSCNFTNSRTLSSNSQFRRVSGEFFFALLISNIFSWFVQFCGSESERRRCRSVW